MNYKVVLLFLLLIGCKHPESSKSENNIGASEMIRETIAKSPSEVEKLVLKENSIHGISLPLEQGDLLEDLSKAFDEFDVTKDIGQWDGPDFHLYSIMKEGEEIAYFEMSWEDSLEFVRLNLTSPIFIDQYQLRVGDSLEKVAELRNPRYSVEFDHVDAILSFENSHISYLISFSTDLPDTLDYDLRSLSNEQLETGQISHIMWTRN